MAGQTFSRANYTDIPEVRIANSVITVMIMTFDIIIGVVSFGKLARRYRRKRS